MVLFPLRPIVIFFLVSGPVLEKHTHHNELKLLQQIAGGGERAFRQLFELYKDRFYVVALKMSGSSYVAEEIVQEVFILLWQKRDLLAAVTQPRPYLFTVFYRCIYQHFRSEAVEKKFRSEIAAIADQTSENDRDHLHLEEQYQLMDKAVSQLPAQQATAYKLAKQEGMSREEVAKAMGVSPHTVKNHLAEAIRRLREITGKAGVFFNFF